MRQVYNIIDHTLYFEKIMNMHRPNQSIHYNRLDAQISQVVTTRAREIESDLKVGIFSELVNRSIEINNLIKYTQKSRETYPKYKMTYRAGDTFKYQFISCYAFTNEAAKRIFAGEKARSKSEGGYRLEFTGDHTMPTAKLRNRLLTVMPSATFHPDIQFAVEVLKYNVITVMTARENSKIDELGFKSKMPDESYFWSRYDSKSGGAGILPRLVRIDFIDKFVRDKKNKWADCLLDHMEDTIFIMARAKYRTYNAFAKNFFY